MAETMPELKAGQQQPAIEPQPTAPEPKPSRRASLLQRLQKSHPDKGFGDDTDDEALYGAIDDEMANGEKSLSEYRDRENKVVEALKGDPRKAQYFMDITSGGKDPLMALVERFGMEAVEAFADPQMREKLAEANKKYLEQVARNKELEDEYDKNIERSKAALQEVQESDGISEEEGTRAIEALNSLAYNVIVGKYSPDDIRMMVKAMNYDKDVSEAQEEGRISGRNEKIQAEIRKPQGGDGLPALSGKNNTTAGRSNRPLSIFDLARGDE